MLLIDPKTGDIIDANPSAVEFYGFSHQEICSKNIYDLNTLPKAEVKKKVKSIRENKIQHAVFKHRVKDNSLRDVAVFISNLKIGSKDHNFVVIQDITELVVKQDELNRFKRIAEHSFAFIGMANLDRTVLYFNQSMRKAFDVPEYANLSAYKVFDFYTDKGKEKIRRVFKTLLEDDYWNGENEMRSLSGKVMKVLQTVILIRDEMGNPLYTSSIALDITDQKIIEAERYSQMLRYRMFMQTASSAIHIMDKNGKLIEWNESFKKHLGFSDDELTGLYIWDWDSQRDKDELLKGIAAIPDDGISLETVHRTKDGTEKIMLINAHQFIDKNENYYFASGRDITKQKLEEREIKQHLSLTSAILESIHEGILVVDLNGKVIRINNKFAELWNIPATIIDSKDDKTLLDYILKQLADPDGFINKVTDLYARPEAESFDHIYFTDDRIFERISKPVYIGKEPVGRVWSFFDITASKRAEREIRKSKRIHEFIANTNDLVLHSKSEMEIYDGICKIAVESGNFVFAWVGLPDKATITISPVAWAGQEADYLKNLNFSLEDIPDGNGPIGKAYRRAKYYYCNDIENDPVMKPWRKEALGRNYRSSVAFPIKLNDRVISMFMLYAATADFFSPDEIRLLERVTENISFALHALNNEREKMKAEAESAKLAEIIENTQAYVFVVDMEFRFIYMNDSAKEKFGIGKDEDISILSGLDFVPEETKMMMKTEEAKFFSEGKWVGEINYLNRSGEVFPVLEVAVIHKDEEGVPKYFSLTLLDISKQKKYEKELKELYTHLQTVIEDERLSIAKEIHENLGQNLVAIKMNAELLKSKVKDSSEEIKNVIDEQIKFTREVINTSRTLFNILHPALLDELGLVAAIRWYAEEQLGSLEINFEMNTNAGDGMFSKIINLGFYRVFQKCLSNVILHAKARNLMVDINENGKYLTMRIQDDGIGFDMNEVNSLRSHSIILMRERVEVLKGKFNIHSIKGEGTTVSIEVPIY